MDNKGIIEIYRNQSQVINDAIDRVVVEVYKKKREEKAQSFLLTGCSTGCGTTTNAINLAVALANSGWRTILIDCDIRKGMRYKRLNAEAKIGLSDFLNGTDGDCIYHTNYPNLDYMPCGSFSESPVRLFCSQAMEQLVEQLEMAYDYIIYDFPSINVVPDAEIMMPIVDGIMLITALNETGKKQLADAKQKILPEKYMGVIANKVDPAQYRHFIKDYDYFREQKMSNRFKAGMKKKSKKK